MNGISRERTVIRRSVSKLLGLAFILAVFVAIGVWLIQGGAVETRGEISVLIGWLITVFSALGWIVLIQRLIFGHYEPVELSTHGFWDKRALRHEVPWSAVSRLSTWSHRGTSMLRVQLKNDAMEQITLTPTGQITRRLNKPFGLDGIYVGCEDLDISYQELRLLFQRYLSEHSPAATDDSK